MLIYDSWNNDYKSPFGAVKRDESIRFTIKLSKDTKLDFAPVLVVFRTGFKERFLSMTQQMIAMFIQQSFPQSIQEFITTTSHIHQTAHAFL